LYTIAIDGGEKPRRREKPFLYNEKRSNILIPRKKANIKYNEYTEVLLDANAEERRRWLTKKPC
jgi:hypothetical protein